MFWHWGSITTAKDYIKENGFEIAKDIRVRCSSCGKIHVFEKDFADPETWTEEANMGTRTEYTFPFEGKCSRCGVSIKCTVRVSEYPPGTMEGSPSIECDGCEIIGVESVSVEYYDYEAFMNSPNTDYYAIPRKNRIVLPSFSAALDDGRAILLPRGDMDFTEGSTIQIEIPAQRRLFDILVDETNVIHFDTNGASLAEIIDATNPRNTAIKLLGKVAEAVVVRRCADNNIINKKWLDKARRGNSRIDVANRFIAVGTGLHSTKRKYPHKYNPSDSQRDIIWMDENGNIANVIGSNSVSGLQAGLQIKVSGNGVNYVQRAVVANRYEVPIVYFPLNNDFDRIVHNINRKVERGDISPVIVGEDLINAIDIDRAAYNSVREFYPILLDLFYGRISADDFVKEATGIASMQNAILANALENRASKILVFR